MARQYNIDRAGHLQGLGLGSSGRSLWLGVDFMLGRHHHQDDPGLSAVGHAGHEGHDDHAGHDHADHSGDDHAEPPVAAEPEAKHAHDEEHDHGGHAH